MTTAAGENLSPRQKYLRLAGWLFESFGPLVIFYAVWKLWALKPAIISGIVTGFLLVAREVYRSKKVSPFTVYCAVSVAVFGYLDLRYATNGFFVKLEPALGNLATGLFFLTTVILGRPIIIEFAEKQAGRSLAHARRYLTAWTVAWSVFFFVRSAVFVWIAYHVELGGALLLRGTIMPASFAAMMLVEPIVRRLVFGKEPHAAPAAQPAVQPAVAVTANNPGAAGDARDPEAK